MQAKLEIISAGGTLFLDEIHTPPLDVQAALLGLAQHNEVTGVGSNRVKQVDVRLMCAAKGMG